MSENYISYGRQYIYKINDLFIIYILLKQFYIDVLIPLYGESYFCDLEYDGELRILKIRKYGIGKSYRKNPRIIQLMLNENIERRVFLLLNSLYATGIINSPLYSLRVSFSTKIEKLSDIGYNSLVTTKGGKGKEYGYFKLEGEII